MLDKLKADFDGILELVNKCPANLQEMAFKTILEHWFTTNTIPAAPPKDHGKGESRGQPAPGGAPDAVKPFLTANAITTEILHKVFHPTGPGAQLLASDIPAPRNRISRLTFDSPLRSTGARDRVVYLHAQGAREMAVHYNSYDSANFSANLKQNKNYFRPREKGADLELSGPGLKKAGDLIKAIAAEA